MYLLSTKQQQIPDATKTTTPEEEMIDSEDPAMSGSDDTDSDNEHAKRRKIRRVTFNKEVKIETYNSPYCDPTFMVSHLHLYG